MDTIIKILGWFMLLNLIYLFLLGCYDGIRPSNEYRIVRIKDIMRLGDDEFKGFIKELPYIRKTYRGHDIIYKHDGIIKGTGINGEILYDETSIKKKERQNEII